jgi:hypothetical protein
VRLCTRRSRAKPSSSPRLCTEPVQRPAGRLAKFSYNSVVGVPVGKGLAPRAGDFERQRLSEPWPPRANPGSRRCRNPTRYRGCLLSCPLRGCLLPRREAAPGFRSPSIPRAFRHFQDEPFDSSRAMTTGRSNISQLSQSRRIDLPEAGDDAISVYSENASVRSGSVRSGSVRSKHAKSRSDAASEAGSGRTASTRHTVVSEARSDARSEVSDQSRCHRLTTPREPCGMLRPFHAIAI